MSSDTFLIRVLEKNGRDVKVRGAMTGAQGFKGLPHPDGRSFFMMLAYLQDPAPAKAPPTQCGALRQALHRDLGKGDARQPFDLLGDAQWLEANVDRYVSHLWYARARGIDPESPDEDVSRFGQWLWEKGYGENSECDDAQKLYLDTAPFFECTVVFADERYAEHFVPGDEFGTVAYAAHHEVKASQFFARKLRRKGVVVSYEDTPDWTVDWFTVAADGSPIEPPPRLIAPVKEKAPRRARTKGR